VGGGPTSAAAVAVPGAYGGVDDPTTGLTVVGYIHGLPVATSSAVSPDLGGGSTEDAVIVYDKPAGGAVRGRVNADVPAPD
jgi:hypothetical protein